MATLPSPIVYKNEMMDNLKHNLDWNLDQESYAPCLWGPWEETS